MNSLAKNSKENFGEWLRKQNTIVILFVLFLPIPITNMVAATVLGAKKIKYGHWYLVAVNLLNTLAVVSLIRFFGDLWFF